MRTLLWTCNILGWPVIHLLVSRAVLSMPCRWFTGRDALLSLPTSQAEGNFYRKWLGVRRWKHLLPDGAPWLGGFSKKRLESRSEAYLRRFIEETRRAEVAHWCTMLFLPLFFPFNPAWARWVMTVYAVAANAPCILTQRYNRAVLVRINQRNEGTLSTDGREPGDNSSCQSAVRTLVP